MKIKKIIAAALVLLMALTAVPMASLAEGVSNVAYEAKQMSKLDKAWTAIEAAEAKAMEAGLDRDRVIRAVYEAALNIENVDTDSFSDFTKDGFFFNVDGMYCAYNYRLRNELQTEGVVPIPEDEKFVVYPGTDDEPVVTRAANVAGSKNVLLVAPYYGHDSSFTDQYKNEAQSIANTTGGTYTLIQSTNATGPNIASNYTNKGVVIYDSHGVQSGSSSYLCLTTSTGITTTDYNNGWAVKSGSAAYIDGRYIKNHVSGTLSNCFVWMAICEGMKAGGKGTTGTALLSAGAAGVYGYSQSVSFTGDYKYEATFWTQMKKGATVAEAIKVMKSSLGNWDPAYSSSSGAAWPIVMSATDPFPSNPDSTQTVYCDWKLFGDSSSSDTITSVSVSNVSVAVGGTANVSVNVQPSTANYTITSYSSSNTSVATVSSSGVVTGKAAGTATLTVKVKDNVSGTTYTKTATITVSTFDGYVEVSTPVSGQQYIIAIDGKAVGNTAYSNNHYLTAYAVTLNSDGTVVVPSNVTASNILWTASGNSTSGWSFKNVGNGKYMGLDSSEYLAPSSTAVAWTYDGSDLNNQIDSEGYYYLSLASSADYFTTSKSTVGTVKLYKYVGTDVTPTAAPTATPKPTTAPTAAPTATPTAAPTTAPADGSYVQVSTPVSGQQYIIAVDGNAVGNTAYSDNHYLTAYAVTLNSDGTVSIPSSVATSNILWTASGNSTSGWSFKNVGNGKYMGLDSSEYLYPSSTAVAWTYDGTDLNNQIDSEGYYYLSLATSNAYFTTSKDKGGNVKFYKYVGTDVTPTAAPTATPKPTTAPTAAPTAAPTTAPDGYVYSLTDTLENGKEYLIVSSNAAGQAYALTGNAGYTTTTAVNIVKESGYTYIPESAVSAKIVWTGEKDDNTGYIALRNNNDGRYIGMLLSSNVYSWSSASLAAVFTYDSFQLLAHGLINKYIGWDGSNFVFTADEGSSVYLYVKEFVEANDPEEDEVIEDEVIELVAPVINASIVSGKPVISWNAVDGAESYDVYRAIKGGTYTYVGTSDVTTYTDNDTLTGGAKYYYKVCAVDKDGNIGPFSAYSMITAPSATVVLTAPTISVKLNNGTPVITWSSVNGAESYNIYRAVKGGAYSRIATANGNTYTDTASLTAGKTYYYKVCAVDANGKEGPLSSYGYIVATAANVDLIAPSITAKLSGGRPVISWSSVNGAASYEIYRAVKGGTYSIIGTASTTSYTDTAALTAGKVYYYKVRAIGKAGNAGPLSSYAYITATASTPLAAPTVSASVSGSTPTIKWNAISGAASYEILCAPKGGNYTLVGVVTGTSFTDAAQLNAGGKYYYKVRAVDANGVEGELSAYVGVTVPGKAS